MKMRSFAATVAATVAVTSLTACGTDDKAELADSWDEIVEAAKDEGTLTLYTSAGSGPTENLVASFTEEYGIDVELVKGVDSDLLPKVETEQQIDKGIADVIITSDQTWVADHPDAVTELRGPSVDDAAYDAGTNAPDGTWAATHAFIAALSWNTEEAPDGLTDIDDLLDSDLGGGQIGIPDPDISPSIVSYYQQMEEAYGDDFLTRLAELEPRLYTSTAAVMQALVSGEISASPYTQPMVDEQEAGAPVDWTVPSAPWGVRSYGGALTSAPHPNAAQLFIDFVLSQDGQTAYTAPKYGTPRSDVDGAASPFAEAHLVAEYPSQEDVDAFRERFKEMFS